VISVFLKKEFQVYRNLTKLAFKMSFASIYKLLKGLISNRSNQYGA